MRSIIISIATGLLGFCLGTLTGPIDLRAQGSLQRENAAMRKEIELYERLIESSKSERRRIRDVMEGK